ncbi:repetin-like [Heteronotia binoei]|uniref:repetin-like n=1 Tax=Heteronotia binoei TaxID=13085 RepID=UPI00293021D7|nr:repetin-like [Heteronotia binoei]
MPQLLDSICIIIGIFHKYAKRDGDCFTLSRREMKRLMRKEFSEILENPRDPQTIELVLQLLDLNKDCLVDFNEFLILMFRVVKACYSHLHPSECLPQQGGSRGALRERDSERDGRIHNRPRDNGEERTYAHERGGSDQTHSHPAESSANREERREYLSPVQPVGQTDDRSHQVRNFETRGDQGRIHQSLDLNLKRIKLAIINQEKGHQQPKRNLNVGQKILRFTMTDVVHHMSFSHEKETEITITENPHED